jgi:hypothetical protein
VDETAQWRAGVDRPDEEHHLAKVKVAGSNPVFRSSVMSQVTAADMDRYNEVRVFLS